MFQALSCADLHFFLHSEIQHRNKTGTPQFNNPLCTLGLRSAGLDLAATWRKKIIGEGVQGQCAISGLREQQPSLIWKFGEPLIKVILVALLSLPKYRIFHTKNGYLRVGPIGCQVGDRVCVVFGCNIPVILRPVDNHYCHAGPCYVVGLMEGEVMLGLEMGKWQAQEFEIR